MKKADLIKLIEGLEDEVDVLDTLKENEEIKGLIKPFDASKLALEDFTKLLQENDTIKGYWTSEKNRAVTEGIEGFKKKDMKKLIDEAVKAKSNEGKTPEQIKLEELETKLAEMEKEKTIATNKANYSKILGEKGLSTDLLDFIYADEEAVFNENIDKINTIIQSAVTSSTNKILNNNEYIPPTSSGGVALSGVEKAFYERNGDLAPQ
ncbi:MAG: DUF4355 domain-containing protein [Clostridium sp.]|jgi:hypothetical protein|uniref:capsid assembly scaffolding protein Gp46 family protein n=1 Tax=Clostridium sp. TaxID=1506 RepID=UPI0028FE95A8|nr:DUF4355 domain-containing protein [Clostridium sp.]MDU1095796.1 DUF4355 domain-containing protein [Clostridioides difficile]MDU1125143.1 DUF4355 domain-containing protein [Clostridium sp.]MDU3676190.1 DUF4355 domain-containing protein [Clostridium sp.]MDU6874032.1 DUF4355 domain-containing protein [Clostridium sp.]MDU6935059.1 DUF4355 domain-containing protein [Clostridium sp.]